MKYENYFPGAVKITVAAREREESQQMAHIQEDILPLKLKIIGRNRL